MNNDLLNKLKKLLNLSKSVNEHEADAALAKAQELATNAGIDLAIVAARGEEQAEKLEMVEESIGSGARLPTTQKYASWILNEFFHVHVIYTGGRWGGRAVNILGDRKDVEFAKFVNEFVQDELQRRWENYKRSNNISVKFKSTFLYNCYRGLKSKLAEARSQTETARFSAMDVDQRAATESKYALVLSSKKQALDAFTSTSYPTLRRASAKINLLSNGTVAKDAYNIGQSINIHRPISC